MLSMPSLFELGAPRKGGPSVPVGIENTAGHSSGSHGRGGCWFNVSNVVSVFLRVARITQPSNGKSVIVDPQRPMPRRFGFFCRRLCSVVECPSFATLDFSKRIPFCPRATSSARPSLLFLRHIDNTDSIAMEMQPTIANSAVSQSGRNFWCHQLLLDCESWKMMPFPILMSWNRMIDHKV